MNRVRFKGIILIWVILALAMVAVTMLVLAEGANTLFLQADAAYCQAVERNLTASALAWTQKQLVDGATPATGEPVTLDSTQIGSQRDELAVDFVQVEDSSAKIRVRTFCAKGRQTLDQTRQYAVSRP